MSRQAPNATPMAFVRAIVLAYQARDLDPTEALAAGQVTAALLRSPNGRVTATQLESISHHAMRELDDEALGWFSRALPWGSYGLLVRASLHAPSLAVALKRWCRHHGLLTPDVRLTLSSQGRRARIDIEERVALPAELREFALLTLLRNVHGVACWLIDSRIPLSAVRFPFEAPRHAEAYDTMFPGPSSFAEARASLAFDSAYLEMPPRRDEEALRTMLQRALRLIVLPYRRDRLLVQRVRELLRARPEELRVADEIARELALSVRSLHRQLRDEGASLQALKDEARREIAMALLQRTTQPVKAIALQAGFADSKAFSRAFSQWTGLSPSAYRKGV